MMPTQQGMRPPYVKFEKRPIETRSAGGTPSFKDEDFIIVTPQGSKDSVDRRVSEWFPALQKEVREERFPAEWLKAYRESYEAWKHDQEPPINGTPVRNWPAASPAEIKILTMLGIVAVEDLAAANAEMQNRIGMGAVSLVQRAKDFITAKTDHAPLVARLDALEVKLRDLEFQNKTLREDKEMLEGQLRSTRTYVQDVARSGGPALERDLNDRLQDARASVAQGPSDAALIQDAIDETLG